MNMKKRVDLGVFLGGAFSALLGCTVIFGWYIQSSILVQVLPSFAPMQYNTALGFVLCGLGVIFLILRKPNIARFLGGGACILGGATFLQYIYQVDLGIDEIFMDHGITTKTSHPGRMAPNTALCFFLCGLAVFSSVKSKAIQIIFSKMVFLLALLALIGYAIGAEGIYGWGNLTRMAIHTATGFIILSVALFLHGIYVFYEKKIDPLKVAPVSSALLVLVLSVFSWYVAQEEAKARNEAYFNELVIATEDMLLDRFSIYEESLRGGLGLYYASQSVERKEWSRFVSALNIEDNLPGISGVGYVDYVLAQDVDAYVRDVKADDAPDFRVHPQTFYPDKFFIKFIEPQSKNMQAVGLDIGFEANRRTAAERARDLGVSALTKKIILVQDSKKTPGFLLLVPVYATKETPSSIAERREHLLGWVYAPFIGSNFLSGIHTVNKGQLDFEVYDGDKAVEEALIYSNQTDRVYPENTMITQIKIAGRIWTIVWHANEKFMPPASNDLALMILICGFVFSVLIYLLLAHLLRMNEIITHKVDERTRALKESENRQKAILENTVDAIITINKGGVIQSFNPAAEKMFGYQAEDIINQNISILMPDPHRSAHDGYLAKYMSTGKATIIGSSRDLEAVRRDGTIFPINLAVSRVELDDKILFSGIVRDITEEQAAKEQIIKANKELKRSNLELERFAYIASHDLQEPLRKIGGFTARLEKHFADDMDEKAQQYMDFVTGGVSRMRDLISGLLEYSKVTTSEDKIEETNVNDVVEAAIDNLSETIKDHKAKVHFEGLPVIYYDRLMLTQLFQNLIGNAIKYRSEKSPDIHIEANKERERWVFSVSDNGMGVEEKYLERIFEMFQRLHRKEDISGTGIGLSLCTKIVERYGGEIWVTSEVGVGSVFYFSVPVKREALS